MGLSRALDVLLPRRCLLCREASGAGLCTGCDADLPAAGNACDRCGIPLVYPWSGSSCLHLDARLCGACIRKPPPFDRTLAALDYVFPVTVLVQRFKFNRSFACGAVLANRLLRALEADLARPRDRPASIIPVPLHSARQFLRAFNQAEVLARDLGNALGIPVSPRALRRRRRTPAQSGLSAAARKKNLNGAFTARPNAASDLAGKHVALVDDVMTTGATVGECARVLKQAGVQSVAIWVVARAL